MSFAVARYKSVNIQTVTPVQLVVKLYDGALRFLAQAQEAIENNDFSARGKALSKAHAVVSELQSTLDQSHAPELCQELDRLYEFTLHQITQCAVSGNADHLKSPISILEQLRGAWVELASRQ